MLCTFPTEHGTLVIRSEDVRRIEDAPDSAAQTAGVVCFVTWFEEGERLRRRILGTAAENLARLKGEEWKAVEEAEQVRKRVSASYPAQPVPRGRT